jgi:Icc-related predicted phosphoesterase
MGHSSDRSLAEEGEVFMRRFLMCCGVHSKSSSLEFLREAVKDRKPDGVLFAGGILAPSRQPADKQTPWSISREDSLFFEEFFAVLGNLGTFSAVIPGPAGEPLEEFYRLGMHAEINFPHVHIAHATLVEKEDVAVSGVGGSIGETALLGIDSYSRTTTEFYLRSLWRAEKPRKILLLPAAPPGPLGGPEGSSLVGDLIDSWHPSLCVVAGQSSLRGVLRIGHTQIVNPGRLADGSAAWLDWSRPGHEQVEYLGG